MTSRRRGRRPAPEASAARVRRTGGRRKSVLASLLVSGILAACAGGTPGSRGATAAPGVVPSRQPPEAVRLVARALAAGRGAEAVAPTVVSWEAVTWPDASLGCPQSGVLYAQATVPGFRILFRAADGATVTVNADQSGRRWVECLAGRVVRRAPAS